MYDFRIYTGKGTCEDIGLGSSGDIVMALCSNIPSGKNFKIFFDNWFSSLQLAVALKEKQILCVGTVRSDRMGQCPLMNEAKMKKKGRGSFDWRVETDHNVALVRWHDGKAINLLSTYAAIDPQGTAKRWSAAEKCSVQVNQPYVVKEYNSSWMEWTKQICSWNCIELI
jgi:hypothetical protein